MDMFIGNVFVNRNGSYDQVNPYKGRIEKSKGGKCKESGKGGEGEEKKGRRREEGNQRVGRA